MGLPAIKLEGAKKGASSARTPVEATDSLLSTSYANILDLIAEGEIAGFCDANWNIVSGADIGKAVLLDNTPLMSSDGTYNFENVSIDYRLGTVDQEYIGGYPSVESETAVGVELRSDSPFVRAISNSELSALRINLAVTALSKADTSNGDINGYSVAYAIDLSTDGGAYTTVITNAFTGKTTTTYTRSERIELPPGSSWQVRIRRLTANANSSTIADTTSVVSITEIIDAKLRYPMSALMALKVDASQFSNVPSRAFRAKLKIIRVPANYNPDTRAYATSGTGTQNGVWDGTFKLAWSDNPAWVFYDLVLADVYGLGNLVDASQADKWKLYTIGQYCDVLVSDGKGGMEPRFTCNTYIQSRASAFQVLRDFASVFRGISYYSSSQIYASADMPADPAYLYNASNVIGGAFTYAGSSRTARYTAALVSWVNLDNAGAAETTYVEYRDGIDRYGYRQTEITAFACTSESQAQRVGQHVLLTNCLETETVSFAVGLDSLNCVLGDIILIADPARAGRRMGGRISAATDAKHVTLDKVDGIKVGDTLFCKLPSGALIGRVVDGIAGRVVSVAIDYPEVPAAQSVWAVTSDDLALQPFRVLNVKENENDSEDGSTGDFTITALKYVESKFAAIDDGAVIDTKPITVVPASAQKPPTGITITGRAVIVQGIATNVMDITWTAPAGAVAYEVQWRKDDGNWVTAGRVGTTSCEIAGIYTGQYLARVRAVNASDVKSIWATSLQTGVNGKTGAPPTLASLNATGEIFAIKLDWAFRPGSSDTDYTEIYYGTSPAFANAIQLGQYAYPTNTARLQGLAAGVQFFFWGRLIDKSGNVGAWYPDEGIAGIVGESSSDAGAILDYIAGKIGKTQLAGDLLTAIDGIAPDMAGDAELFAGDDTRYAGVWSQLYAQQEGDMALAKRVDTVQATVDDSTALVQQTSQTVVDLNGKVSATYTVRAQISSAGQIYMAGMGVGVEQQADGSYQSQILMQADRFALINVANGALTTPFVIQSGQTFISQAFIGDGWITNAKIGDFIQSTNYVAGVSGWRLDKSGTFEINSADGTGNKTRINNNGGTVWDAAGTVRLRWGFW